jgi:hypothetical protein
MRCTCQEPSASNINIPGMATNITHRLARGTVVLGFFVKI